MHPYMQLAAIYRESGDDNEAREVLIAAERQRRKRQARSPGSGATYFASQWDTGTAPFVQSFGY